MEYNWPGNIRELKNIVERLYHLSEGTNISVDDLPKNIHRKQISFNENTEKNNVEFLNLKDAVTSFENEYIAQTLDQSSSLQECANKLGISLSTLVRKKRNLL